MISQIECPGCHEPLAYSAALRGRTVRCHHCQHAFPVANVLGEPSDAVGAETALTPAPLPSRLSPPPLPMRSRPGSPYRGRDAETPGSEADFHGGATEGPASVDAIAAEVHERRSAVGPVLGLVALFAFGFMVMAGGIGYLVSAGSSRSTTPAAPAAAPPGDPPLEIERPKSLQEVLGGDAKNDLPPAPPGAMQFDPNERPRRPGFPHPPRGFGPPSR